MIIYLSTFLMISALVFPWYVISYYYEKRIRAHKSLEETQGDVIDEIMEHNDELMKENEELKERVRELEGK